MERGVLYYSFQGARKLKEGPRNNVTLSNGHNNTIVTVINQTLEEGGEDERMASVQMYILTGQRATIRRGRRVGREKGKTEGRVGNLRPRGAKG